MSTKVKILSIIISWLCLNLTLLISCEISADPYNSIQNAQLTDSLKKVDSLKNENLIKALSLLDEHKKNISNASITNQLEYFKLRSQIYNELTKHELAKDTATKGLLIAKQLTSPPILLSDLYYTRGFSLESLGDYYLAKKDYMSGLDIAESLNDKTHIAQGLINVGALYYLKEDYSHSLTVFNEALTIAKSLDDEEIKGYIYSELGNLYSYLGEDKNTLKFYQQAYEHYMSAGKFLDATNILTSIGGYYLQNGDYDKAIASYKDIIKKPKSAMTDQLFYSAYSGLAWAYDNKKEPDSELAYQYNLIAGQYLSGIEQVDLPYYYLMDKAYILRHLKRYDDVLDTVFQAEKLLTREQIEHDNWNYLMVLNLRANTYFDQGLYETAYNLKSEYINKVIKSQQKNNNAEIQDLRLKFESEQADLQKEILEKQRAIQKLKLSKISAKNSMQKQYILLGIVALLFILWAILKLVKGQKTLVVFSRTDALTGISNRRHLEKIGDDSFSQAYLSKSQLSVLMIDIDYFKQVNDEFGHKTGDSVLKKAVTVIKQTLRSNDSVGRFGGEEFVVILPNSDQNQAEIIAERIRLCVAQYRWKSENLPEITISIGLATFNYKQHKTFDDLLNQADKMLYQAKSEGRNRLCF